MTVEQVAEKLGISEKRVREYCQAGRLGTKIGRQWIITAEQFAAFMETYSNKPGRRPTASD